MTPSSCENRSWSCVWNQALMDCNHYQCLRHCMWKSVNFVPEIMSCAVIDGWVGGVVKMSICKAWTLCLRSITCAGRYRWWWIICGFWVTWEVVWGLLRILTDHNSLNAWWSETSLRQLEDKLQSEKNVRWWCCAAKGIHHCYMVK
jgi:hypothetical protein